MDKLIYNGKIFDFYEYPSENEFEREVVSKSNDIFGYKSVYIDVKKRIGEDKILTIPDGYLIDFSFQTDPRLYIIENELSIHDPYKHIGEQLLKFAISYKASGRNIKKFLLENILKDSEKKKIINNVCKNTDVRNIDAFLEEIIFEKPVAAIVIIDIITSDLENVLSNLTMKTDIVEFQTFISGKEKIYKFTPFQQDIRLTVESGKSHLKIEDLDTIVVPANEDGFNKVFLKENCWYAIRISSSMLDRLKYIAGYQTAPISAITYLAEILKIEKYRNTGKYIVYFKKKAQKIKQIKLGEKRKGAAPQAPRYTSFKRLKKAKTINEVF
jgi:hypothetical protein